MSDAEQLASAVKAPREGAIRVLALTTSASAVQDTGVSSGQAYVTLIADVACYVTFGADGTNTVTNPDETAATGGGRTWRLAADQPQSFLVQSGADRYFKAKGSASGYLRWYVSSL